MKAYKNINDLQINLDKTGYQLLSATDGLTNGCQCGISVYRRTEYNLEYADAHDDQEGFLVLEGYGKALIGDEEVSLVPGACFVIPPHAKHAMCKTENCEYCKVFWFHAQA